MWHVRCSKAPGARVCVGYTWTWSSTNTTNASLTPQMLKIKPWSWQHSLGGLRPLKVGGHQLEVSPQNHARPASQASP